MAKKFIEPLPKLHEYSYQEFSAQARIQYGAKYKEVDDKGRYLYWEDFKWRVDNGDDALKAWYTVKSARNFGRKKLVFTDKKSDFFTYSVPEVLQEKLYDIVEFSRLGIVPRHSIGSNYLLSSLAIEEAISSSQLEGASTTRRIAKEMIKIRRIPKNEDEQMIYNNYLLMKALKNEKDEDLSIDLILRFHKIATYKTYHNHVIPGEFRKDNEIFILDRDDNLLFQSPDYNEIVPRMQQLCTFANTIHKGTSFMHPLIKAIILHYMIGYIHPFSDGNDRTARALFYWYMLKNGYDYFEYISISKFLKEAPVKYTKSYQYVDADNNDLNYFIFYQIEIIERAIKDLRQYLKVKSSEYEEIDVILKESYLKEVLNFVQKSLIQEAMKKPGSIFTASEVATEYDISVNTARTYMNKLVEYQILSPYKKGKTKAYIAPANLHEIIEAT
jgi:Fic family protein